MSSEPRAEQQLRVLEEWRQQANSMPSSDKIGDVIAKSIDVFAALMANGPASREVRCATRSLESCRDLAMEFDRRKDNALRKLVYGLTEVLGVYAHFTMGEAQAGTLVVKQEPLSSYVDGEGEGAEDSLPPCPLPDLTIKQEDDYQALLETLRQESAAGSSTAQRLSMQSSLLSSVPKSYAWPEDEEEEPAAASPAAAASSSAAAAGPSTVLAPGTLFECPLCAKAFMSFEYTLAHLRNAHGKRKSDIPSLRTHPGPAIKCPLCGSQYVRDEDFDEHMRRRHPPSTTPVPLRRKKEGEDDALLAPSAPPQQQNDVVTGKVHHAIIKSRVSQKQQESGGEESIIVTSSVATSHRKRVESSGKALIAANVPQKKADSNGKTPLAVSAPQKQKEINGEALASSSLIHKKKDDGNGNAPATPGVPPKKKTANGKDFAEPVLPKKKKDGDGKARFEPIAPKKRRTSD